MNLASIKSAVPAHRKRTRVGRGPASGLGKTSGKGNKGQKSRSGYGATIQKQGGQMPLFRRLPKRGFNNKRFQTRYEVINVGDLDRFDNGGEVGVETLAGAGLVRHKDSKVKVLGDGRLTKKLKVKARCFSKAAIAKISNAGGSAEVE